MINSGYLALTYLTLTLQYGVTHDLHEILKLRSSETKISNRYVHSVGFRFSQAQPPPTSNCPPFWVLRHLWPFQSARQANRYPYYA
jgi:hypothetical protein